MERFVEGDRLEGRFAVTTVSGELSGNFKARFDPLAALDLLSAAGRVPEALAKRLRGDPED